MLALACAITITTETSLIWKETQRDNMHSMFFAMTSLSVLSVTFLTILTLLFAYSFIKITMTLRSADLNMSINKTMLTINISLLLVLLMSWIVQWLLYGTNARIAFYTSYGLSTVAKLVIRVVFLALIEQFCQKLTIKSSLTAKGELVVYGCDGTGKQIFSYTMQATS